MEWHLALGLIMGSFLLLMFIGVPVVYAFLSVNIVAMFFLMGGEAGLIQLIQSMYESLSVFVLLPITLFILMGEVMFRSRVAINMISALDTWIGRFPGRLALLSVATGTLAAALSGASIGTTAMLGSTLSPEMEKRGYKKSMSLGPLMGSGGLAIMIPPSGLGVIMAVIAQISVGSLLIAIILPGLLMAFLYGAYIIVRCLSDPSQAPPYDVAVTPLFQRISLTLKYIAPLSSIVFLVVGLIYLGVATPTESAALGTAGCFVLAACYRQFNYRIVRESILNTLRVSVMVLIILAGAGAFSQIMAFTGANRNLVQWAAGLPLHPLLIICAMQLVVIILGGFVSGVPLMMITIPVFMPVVKALGFDPLWFSVIMLLNVEMAQTTPPYGILLYVMKGVATSGTTMGDIIRAAIPFLLCDLIAMVLMIIFPSIVLWLPGQMR